MKRNTPLRARSWCRSCGRSLCSCGEPPKLKRTPLPEVNRERKAKMHARNFGDHADTIRHLPCASCHPELYRPGRPLPDPTGWRLSDPSHAIPRGKGGCGGDKTTLFPQCRAHHEEFEGHGKRRNELHRLSYGIDPLELAGRLWARHLREQGEQ